jgi:hypothetical protein
MKSNLEKFVQTIPYGQSLPTSKIKINSKGEIVIYGKERVWHVQDLNAAIRQQMFHVMVSYESVILSLPNLIRHKGEIAHLKEITEEINSLIGKINYFRNTKMIKDKVNEFEKQLQDAKNILTEKQVKDLTIVTKVLRRANKLLEERKRCEKIITTILGYWIIAYSLLDTNKIGEIKWSQFFESIKKLRTIHANPYKIRTQSVEIKFLQYKFYSLIKENKIEEAKKKLWQAIEKIIPIYPSKLEIKINNKIITIQDGKIITQGRG